MTTSPAGRPIADVVIRRCTHLITCAGAVPRRGQAQSALTILGNGALAASDGRILFVGPDAELDRHVERGAGTRVLDGRGFSVLPGFVDPHTHAIFAGDRRDELRRRLAGESYVRIAAAGGGIVSTVHATREATEQQLVDETRARLDEMLACGTTTCEIKSGYGLDEQTELKMLRAIRRLDEDHAIDVVPTFLGAHEVPVEYRHRRGDYVDLVVDRMIPAVAAGKLAEWCDVFCERGVFSPEESARVLQAGARAGMKPRIHADELAASGGSFVAASVGARSADHLIFVPPEGVIAMANAGVCATLLPCAAFYLKLGRFAPARELIDGSVPVALATDVNPGGGFSPSMPFAMTLACFGMEMTFEEALIAATINAAWSLDRADVAGSLEPGKLADAVFVRGDAVNLVRVGAPAVTAVMKRGHIVSGAVPTWH